MKKRTQVLALGAATAASIVGLITLKPTGPEPGIQTTTTTTTQVAEDSSVWDCHTMGNKICGHDELKSEREALHWLKELVEYCTAQGAVASTWVERHPAGESRPHTWYEVLGRCESQSG